MSSKYDPLYDYLKHLPADLQEKTMTFSTIEEVVGFRLPNSAYRYQAWWANPSSEDDSHVHARAWLGAGWKVETLNLSGKWVRFQRSG